MQGADKLAADPRIDLLLDIPKTYLLRVPGTSVCIVQQHEHGTYDVLLDECIKEQRSWSRLDFLFENWCVLLCYTIFGITILEFLIFLHMSACLS